MRNLDKWRPSKYIFKGNKLIGSRNIKELSLSSRLVADLVAAAYQENIPKYVRGSLLDLGCGKVPLYVAYKDYISDHVCVDWGNSLHKNEFIDFECDLTEELPFEENEFDVIILSDVLEHIPTPEFLCGEINRLLNSGGKLLMNVPFIYWVHESPHDYNRYTRFQLCRLMERAGLTVISVEEIGGSPEVFADMFAKHVQAVPIIGKISAIITQFLAKKFIQTSVGKKISDKTSKLYPLGYFLVAEK